MKVDRMDYLLHRLEAMNELLNGQQSSATVKKKQGDGKKGSAGGFFSAAKGEMTFRRGDTVRASGILGIIHPSDGHPQEELTPDFNWFRPLSYNNPTWTLYWPELTV